ncbi:MAG: hypothetical protein RL748_2228 [Pseudomonadota bacterium]|jgi:sigma-E factor negative regulatory protein RseB
MKQQFWLGCLGLLLAHSAQAIIAEIDPLVEQREAYGWLKKIQGAARQINYSGTFVYQAASQVRTSRISHFRDGKGELQKLEILDGKSREYVRVNDDVTCYIPDAKVMLIENKANQEELFHAMLPANFADQASNYHLRNGEPGRVAGFDCHGVVLAPKDNLRYGYKLCADKQSGLLLLAQTINERNEVLEQIAFTEVTIGNIDKARLKPSVANTQGWRVEHVMVNQSQSSGWQVKWLPPGFKKVRELRRSLNEATPGQREAVQMVFSDGLAGISVFIENSSPGRNEISAQQGAINIISRRLGDSWLTVVGEVPAAAIKQLANSIEYKPK